MTTPPDDLPRYRLLTGDAGDAFDAEGAQTPPHLAGRLRGEGADVAGSHVVA